MPSIPIAALLSLALQAQPPGGPGAPPLPTVADSQLAVPVKERAAHAADVARARACRGDRPLGHDRFEDIEQWLRAWDDPRPTAWQEPERVVEMLRLLPGMRLAEIGAGTGYFNARLARAVGPGGVVYAIDVDPELVGAMRERAAQEGTPNVQPVLATQDDPLVPVQHVDRILLVDAYHHLDARIEYLRRLRAHLADDGLLVVVEWLPGTLARGPEPAYKVAAEKVADEARAASYRQVERRDLEYRYVLVFRPEPKAR